MTTPSSTERDLRLERILADYLHAVEAGTPPDRAEMLARHPDLAAELASFFRNRDAMERMAKPIKQQLPGPETIDLPGVRSGSVGTLVRYFGDYELLEEIARGGMGVVYRARQVSLDRVVAVKMILAGQLASAADVARFIAEATAAGKLDHPNIVPIYEVGEHEGQHYFSMKLVEGGSLAVREARCEGRRASREEHRQAAALLVTVSRAVHHAHQRGILHRDLKPGNILIDAQGRPHVTDFGLARRVEGDSRLTQSGAIVGTPSYMAPEQARSEKVLTTGVDVYSLGAILYDRLTGRPPFQAGTALDTILQVLEREPAHPLSLNPSADRDLATICLKCLEKEPARRYGSAEALADDLERWLHGEPIQARPARSWERARKWARRQPALAALLLVSALAVLSLLAGGLWYNTRLQAALADATQAREDSDEQRDRAQQAKEDADKQREKAQRAREDAVRQRDEAYRNLYVAHVNFARVAWTNRDVAQVLDLLEVFRRPAPDQKDQRGWEWYYQDRRCREDLRTLEGHSREVRSVAFSPDGRQLASQADSGSVPGMLRVWDAASDREVLTLGGVSCFAYSPDGRLLACGTMDRRVRVLDAASGRLLFTLEGHAGTVNGVAFSPDGQWLASAGGDRTVKVWDVASHQRLRTLEGHVLWVESVTFSPDGRWLASVSADRTVKVWDAAGDQARWTLGGRSGPISSVAFSPDGQRLASANGDGTVKVWDTTRFQELRTLKGHSGSVCCVAYSPDGQRLASGSDDKTVTVWDAASGQELRILLGHTGAVTSVAFTPDGQRLASGSEDRTVKMWDAASGQDLRKAGAGTSVAFSPDGQRLASGFRATVKVWDAATLQELGTFQGHSTSVFCVAYSPDGRWLASGSDDKTVKVWDAASGRELRTLEGHASRVTSVAFSPDGQRLASTDMAGNVKVWEAASGRELRTLQAHDRATPGHARAVFSVAFSRDGQRLASGCYDGTIKVWDAANLQELRTLRHKACAAVYSVAFSPDGQRLVSAGEKTVTVWDVASGQESSTFKGYAGTPVRSVVFSPDGQRLALGGGVFDKPGEVKVWDVASGKELLTLGGYSKAVWSVAFSPDGRQLAAAGWDETVRVWDGRPLTPEVRAQREALGLVAFLFAKPLVAEDVVQSIHDNPSIRAAVRQRALALAKRFREEQDPKRFDEASRALVRQRYLPPRWYQQALQQAQSACRLKPGDGAYLSTLGLAQYRLGEYTEASRTLTRSDRLNTASPQGRQPATLAFLAMVQHQLGQKEQAKTTLAKLGQIVKKPPWAKQEEAQGFLREAEELIEGKTTAPKK